MILPAAASAGSFLVPRLANVFSCMFRTFMRHVWIMPEPPTRPRSLGPRNLSEARETIARLQAQLAGHGLPPGGKEPIPPAPQDPHPLLPGRHPPINPQNSGSLDFGHMSPKQFSEMLDRCDDKTLLALLARETAKLGAKQNDGVIAKLHKEFKKRGA